MVKVADKQMDEQHYKKIRKKRDPGRPVLRNCVRAFLAGGTICLIGQAIQEAFIHWFDFDKQAAGNPTVAVLIIISVFFTSIGVYDKFGQWAGAGSAVPVTGFANALSSSALEYRSQGLVLGVGGHMFKLAGSVIVFGTVAAFFIAIIHWVLGLLGIGGGS
ncbi:stage V sporulation protein AC [Longirhabdus pacifica]|uniref:stage V sporulation protein AC n=1 Tax=Longirhabdus pacifica TaxID=2305227 RepID=UPI001008E7DA|nr:stage V sporulation protein AC [Longirhabdus pacifica]